MKRLLKSWGGWLFALAAFLFLCSQLMACAPGDHYVSGAPNVVYPPIEDEREEPEPRGLWTVYKYEVKFKTGG